MEEPRWERKEWRFELERESFVTLRWSMENAGSLGLRDRGMTRNV